MTLAYAKTTQNHAACCVEKPRIGNPNDYDQMVLLGSRQSPNYLLEGSRRQVSRGRVVRI